MRKYEFARKSDGKVPVRGETDRVFVDAKTGPPPAIPQEVTRVIASSEEK